MSTYETGPTLQDIVGDADIHELLDSRLIIAGYPGANTDKYFIEGLPEVVVRHQLGEPELHIRNAVATVYSQLPSHGIPAIPYVPVQHNDELYVVTRKFHGANLQEILNPDMSDALHDTVDNLWGNLSSYVMTGRLSGRMCATDIDGVDSYMLGRTVIDTEDRLTLVDLGERAVDYSKLLGAEGYERATIRLANSIVEIEHLSEKRLAVARGALNSAIDVAEIVVDANDDRRMMLIDIARHILERSIQIDPDDDLN